MDRLNPGPTVPLNAKSASTTQMKPTSSQCPRLAARLRHAGRPPRMSVSRRGPEVVDARSKRRSCEGFRMTAHWDDAACTGAVVRKPPVKERAGGWVGRLLRAMEI